MIDDTGLYRMDEEDIPGSPCRMPPGIYAHRPPGTFKHEILPEPDVAIDPRSPYAVWDQGTYLTRIPYIPDPENPDDNALRIVRGYL